MNEVSLSWSPGDGDKLLEALRDAIQTQFRGDVMAALSALPAPPEPELSLTEQLLVHISQQLELLTWQQDGGHGRRPNVREDVRARLRRLGLMPNRGDEGVAGVTA